jgi:hypothetical protein
MDLNGSAAQIHTMFCFSEKSWRLPHLMGFPGSEHFIQKPIDIIG